MLRFLLFALPASLAYEGLEDAGEGLSLLQLRANRTSGEPQNQNLDYASIIPGDHPGPNPIVTKEECRERALALGLTLGASEWGKGWDFEVDAVGFVTKGCFAYRLCAKGSFASDHLRWHAFYSTPVAGQDVTPEEAANPVTKQYANQQQRIDGPLHLYLDPNQGEKLCPLEERKLPDPPAAVAPEVPVPAEANDQGEAVGDPHVSYGGHHFDLDESDVQH